MVIFWQREKDSNPHKQSQSLSCYPYTIPLCPPGEVVRRRNMTDYSRDLRNVKRYFQISQKIFHGVKLGAKRPALPTGKQDPAGEGDG